MGNVRCELVAVVLYHCLCYLNDHIRYCKRAEERGLMKSYILLLLCVLLTFAIIQPASAGVAQIMWTKTIGQCVTAIDTNPTGTLIFVGLGNGSIFTYDQAGNITRSYSANSTSPKRAIKKIVADAFGNFAWISEANESGFIASTGVVAGIVRGTGRNMTDVAIEGDGTGYATTELKPPHLALRSINGVPFIENTSFGTNTYWTKIGYDPSGTWIVTANESSNMLYFWNLTTYVGWDEFNPLHTSVKNSSQIFIDSFPYRQNISVEGTGSKGIRFKSTTNTTFIQKLNNSYYEYNPANTGNYLYWTIPGNISNVQTDLLNLSWMNTSLSTYNIVLKPGYTNYTVYYGNMSHTAFINNSDWKSNGVVYTDTFLSSTTWVLPLRLTSVNQTLVVAGGGTSGYMWGFPGGVPGGGGGGGMLENYNEPVSGSVVVTVGAGAGSYDAGGGNSAFGPNITAIGGGMGYAGGPGGAGGSGGGGGVVSHIPLRPGGVGVPGQGYNGGTGGIDDTWSYGGGGGGGGAGGAGSYGGNGESGHGYGNGGIGRISTITGSPVYYAGGGAGSGTSGVRGLGDYGGGWGMQGIVIVKHITIDVPVYYYGTIPTLSTLFTQQSRLSISTINQTSTKFYVGNILGISVPSSSNMASIITDTVFYQQYVTANGLGLSYSATLSSGGAAYFTGTPYTVATANSGAAIEGRGAYGNIYDAGGVVKASVFTGGTIRSADISMSSGTFAALGGDEGKVYMLSREGSSTWYSYYTGSADTGINAVSVLWDGSGVVVGRFGGTLEYYNTNVTIPVTTTMAPNNEASVYVFKDGAAYVNQLVTIYMSATTPSGWVPVGSMYTDSLGKISYSSTAGAYYKFVVNNVVGTTSGEGETIWQSNAASPTVYVYVISPSTPYEWNAYYNPTTNNVTVVYSDTIVPESIVLTIKDLKTNINVITRTIVATPNFILEYTDVSGTGSYQVSVVINRMGSSVRDQRMVTSPKTYGITFPNDSNITFAASTLILMIIAGLFSYAHSKRGALAVVIVAVVMMVFRLLPWTTGMVAVVGIAAMFAVLSLFASRVQ